MGMIGQRLHAVIYSFHIPLFIFVMGYFAKKKEHDWIRTLALYLIVQTIYLAAYNVKRFISGGGYLFDYTTPFWLAWYLMVMLIYKLLTPYVLNLSHRAKHILLVCSVTTALLSIYIPFIGARFSLARAITFFPFFVWGTIWKDRPLKINRYALAAAVVVCLYMVASHGYIDNKILYGVAGTPLQRGTLSVVSFVWVAFVVTWVPDNKVSEAVSRIGRNTLSIYLVHGIITRGVFSFWKPEACPENLVICVIFAAGLCLLLAQDVLTKILSLKWIIN